MRREGLSSFMLSAVSSKEETSLPLLEVYHFRIKKTEMRAIHTALSGQGATHAGSTESVDTHTEFVVVGIEVA